MSAPERRPLAVALQYDQGQPGAPRVVAVGRDWLGEKIIETARAHGVPLEPNPALAEALSRVEVDTEIPVELYRAVAEIIGFILRASTPRPAPLRPEVAELDEALEDDEMHPPAEAAAPG
jgi:flagellar biosynthesis protein